MALVHGGLLLELLMFLLGVICIMGVTPQDYVAAVYEQPIYPNPQRRSAVTKVAAVAYMMRNIDKFEEVIKQAKETHHVSFFLYLVHQK